MMSHTSIFLLSAGLHFTVFFLVPLLVQAVGIFTPDYNHPVAVFIWLVGWHPFNTELLYPFTTMANSALYGLVVTWYVHRIRIARHMVSVVPGSVQDVSRHTDRILYLLILVSILFSLCLFPVAWYGVSFIAFTLGTVLVLARGIVVYLGIRWSWGIPVQKYVLLAAASLIVVLTGLLLLIPFTPVQRLHDRAPEDLSFSDTVAAVRRLGLRRWVPLNLRLSAVRWRTDFDMNNYFKVLTRLHPEPGYVLDYVCVNGMDGIDVRMYSRRTFEIPYLTLDALIPVPGPDLSNFDKLMDASLLRVETDETPEGYLQLLILWLEGPRVYRGSSPFCKHIIATRQELDRLMSLPDDIQPMRRRPPAGDDVVNAVMRRGPEPTIEMGSNTVSVTLLTSYYKDGVEQVTYEIARTRPHRIKATNHQTLRNCTDERLWQLR